ncbi:MAG: manganese efflux pump [Lachnospiraceae bacterium]|nr:manganese efflux pump [Lachnospiraceae bacterium]
MELSYFLLFLFNSTLLGVGLAMDAFSVSLANGLNEPHMRREKLFTIAGVFGFFQGLMPMIGWICVHTIVKYFKYFEKCIPWIALILLLFIGGKMLIEGIQNKEDEDELMKLGASSLFIQGIATSIDALSVGFTIAEYGLIRAIICSTIIAVITFIICVAGLIIGKKFGTIFSNKAEILGGIILIFIGIEIFVTGI